MITKVDFTVAKVEFKIARVVFPNGSPWDMIAKVAFPNGSLRDMIGKAGLMLTKAESIIIKAAFPNGSLGDTIAKVILASAKDGFKITKVSLMNAKVGFQSTKVDLLNLKNGYFASKTAFANKRDQWIIQYPGAFSDGSTNRWCRNVLYLERGESGRILKQPPPWTLFMVQLMVNYNVIVPQLQPNSTGIFAVPGDGVHLHHLVALISSS